MKRIQTFARMFVVAYLVAMTILNWNHQAVWALPFGILISLLCFFNELIGEHKYSKKDAGLLLFHLRSHGIECELIGSLKKKGYSNNDIDIYFPNHNREELTDKLRTLLGAKTYYPDHYGQITDWDGFYFYETEFGTVDCFFKGSIEKFDY